jgi:uncharacterized membrane protein YdjX (TVP38/TMEM64 family)
LSIDSLLMTISDPPSRKVDWRLMALVLLVVAVIVAARTLPANRVIEELRRAADQGGVAGMLGFGAAYVALALLFVPGAPLTIVAGAVYGFLWGAVVVSLASATADAAAFLIARHLARSRIEHLARRYPSFAAVDQAIAEGGWKVVALLRLSPAIPYSASNYLYGLTGIRFWPYLLASWVFTLPGTGLYAYLGFLGTEALVGRTRTPFEWLLLATGLAATIGVVVYVTVLTRRVLKHTTDLR